MRFDIQAQIAARFPDALPRPELAAPAQAFGIPALDALLPHGGLARGRLSEIVGAAGSGRTSLVRALVREAEGPVAIVDADRSLCASDFVCAADVWVARAQTLYAADVLLRTRAFGLVIAFGSAGRSAPLVRLQRLTEEAGSVCLFVSDAPQGSSVVTTRLHVRGGEYLFAGMPPVVVGRKVVVTLEKGGPPRSAEVVLHEEEADRLLAHPEAPDRAPVAWRGAGGRKQAPRFAGGFGN